MATGTLPPTGLARRERRLSDQETERRMLSAALAIVSRTGLTVSLDHLSFEDIIRDADVSRSAVYRRWPYKDLFFSDLVKQLALDAAPDVAADELALMKQIVAAHPDWLATPELRHRLLLETSRQESLASYQAVCDSPGWRTYIALHATFMSVADGELRGQVQAALTSSELARTGRIASAWRQLAALLGYRLRPGSPITSRSWPPAHRHHAGHGRDGPVRAGSRREPERPARSVRPIRPNGRCPRSAWLAWPGPAWSPTRGSPGTPTGSPPPVAALAEWAAADA